MNGFREKDELRKEVARKVGQYLAKSTASFNMQQHIQSIMI